MPAPREHRLQQSSSEDPKSQSTENILEVKDTDLWPRKATKHRMDGENPSTPMGNNTARYKASHLHVTTRKTVNRAFPAPFPVGLDFTDEDGGS